MFNSSDYAKNYASTIGKSLLRVQTSSRYRLSKTAEFLGGKSANELMHSLYESIRYIRLIFIGRVNRTMNFQYSEVIC